MNNDKPRVAARRPSVFWAVALAVLLAVVVLLHGILWPFVAGMVLAYVLDAPVNRLERLGLNRGAATLLIIGSFIVGAAGLIVFAVPFLGSEVASFIEDFPAYVRRLHEFATNPSRPWLRRIAVDGFGVAEQSGADLSHLATGWLTDSLRSLWSGGKAALSLLSLLVVTPIVTFYLVDDWRHILAALDRWVPSEQRDVVRTLARDIDETIGHFLRGQGVICIVLAVFYATALKSIGLNHGLLIGIVAGAIGFIPYLGSLTGTVLSLCMALVQFGPDWRVMATIVAVFFVGQLVADYVLTPRLIGRRVHLNPVWLMFAIFALGYLFGFVGVVIAVPLAAAIGVVTRFALRRLLPEN